MGERGGRGEGDSEEGGMNRTFPGPRFEYLQYTSVTVQVIKNWSWGRSVIKAKEEWTGKAKGGGERREQKNGQERLREVGREESRRRDRKE